jgi:N-acetylneuraminic acid mutarotase
MDGSNKNDVWRTADGSTWTQMPDAPWVGRYKTATCVHNGYIYLVGGLVDVWRTNDGTSWTKMTNDLPSRKNHKVSSLNGYIYLIAGQQQNHTVTNEVLRSEDGTTWSQLSNAPFSVSNYASTILDGYI